MAFKDDALLAVRIGFAVILFPATVGFWILRDVYHHAPTTATKVVTVVLYIIFSGINLLTCSLLRDFERAIKRW